MPGGILDDLGYQPAAPVPGLLDRSNEPPPPDFTDRYNTVLSSDQEREYQQWLLAQSALTKRDMSRDNYDYDLRGAFLSGAAADPGNAHFPDTFKKPNHPSFSTRSQYNGADGNMGGTWVQAGDSWTFAPSSTNLLMHGQQGLEDYFRRVEPNTQLLLPSRPETQRIGENDPFQLAQAMAGTSRIWTQGNSTPWDYNTAMGYPGLTGRPNSNSPLTPLDKALLAQRAKELLRGGQR